MGPPGPLRKDGCPDMRYSSNRSWASSSGSSVPLTTGGFYSSGGSSMRSSAASSSARNSSLQLRAVAENAPARLRTDGLPDMRYSANKRFVAEKNLPNFPLSHFLQLQSGIRYLPTSLLRHQVCSFSIFWVFSQL